MSSQVSALPIIAPSRRLDHAAARFWRFLKAELAPYPDRAWVVGRITIAATIVMIVVMTFRIPYGFLGAFHSFLFARESPAATFRAGVKTVLVYAIATLYTIIGAMTMVADPFTHFLWIVLSLFLAFYLIRVIRDHSTAVGLGFTLAFAIPLWDDSLLTVNQRTEHTLWLGFSAILGAAVTVAVEYVFRRPHPIRALTQGFASRLEAVENVLRQLAAGGPLGDQLEREISLHSALGTSGIRGLLLRSGYSPRVIGQTNVAAALVGRLTDLAASLRIVRSAQPVVLEPADRARCLRLAGRISQIRSDVQRRQLPHPIDVSSQIQPSDVPLLPEMERTVALLTHAFPGAESMQDWSVPPPLDTEPRQLLVPDAFSNPDHLEFAVRGSVAIMAAYVVYQAIDWPGLSTALAACVLTALSNIGSSRQKPFLRVGGAIVGGFVFGMGAQVFVLPYVDSIAGFTVLFAVVTAMSAWIATATPRLSSLGVQLVFTFYLLNLQEFAVQDSVAVAGDRLMGMLLGLLSMWLVFDRLWVRDALQEMQYAFARNLRLLAELVEQSRKGDRKEASGRILQLRHQITDGFNAVTAQSDALLFEFGPSRERRLHIRDDFKRWQPTIGILLQLQVTCLHNLFGMRVELPRPIAEAQAAFEEDIAIIARAMSDDVAGRTSTVATDIQESAVRLRQEIHKHYGATDLHIPPPLVDMITLTQTLASILAPLYLDIHATFTNPQQAVLHHP